MKITWKQKGIKYSRPNVLRGMRKRSPIAISDEPEDLSSPNEKERTAITQIAYKNETQYAAPVVDWFAGKC